jgi:hypothetical protein
MTAGFFGAVGFFAILEILGAVEVLMIVAIAVAFAALQALGRRSRSQPIEPPVDTAAIRAQARASVNR